MKKLSTIAFLLAATFSCTGPNSPEDATPGGLRVGLTSAECYKVLQKAFEQDTTSELHINDNVFTDINLLIDLAPLYSTVIFDSSDGMGTGLHVYFSADTISLIYPNSGVAPAKWPENENVSPTINVGDSEEEFLSTILALKQNAEYGKYLQRYTLSEKNLSTASDTFMLARSQWEFIKDVKTGKSFTRIQLFFKEMLLDSINSEEIQIIPII